MGGPAEKKITKMPVCRDPLEIVTIAWILPSGIFNIIWPPPECQKIITLIPNNTADTFFAGAAAAIKLQAPRFPSGRQFALQAPKNRLQERLKSPKIDGMRRNGSKRDPK